ncbi:MAG: transcriptional regulator [bacterium]|nr:transcriptional regulator [bacterium]
MNRSEPSPEKSQTLTGLDKIIHEPGRLAVVSFLYVVDEVDFLFLMEQTALTRGNLSTHMAKLEKAGYVAVEKSFVEKKPRTAYSLTDEGKRAFEKYRTKLLSSLGGSVE